MQKKRLLQLLFFFLMAAGLSAQQRPLNPFDITGRLSKHMLAGNPALVSPDNAVAAVLPDSARNPFNIVVHRTPGVARGISESIERTFRPLEVLPTGDALSNTFIFWFLVALVAFLSFSVATKRGVVIKAWRGFLNDNALNLAQREASGFTGNTPYLLLYVSFLLNAGVFIFLIARFFNQKAFNNLGFLAVCLAGSGVLLLSKHALLRFVGWIYPVAAEVRRYNFLITIFNCVLGLFLLPFNFLVAFVRDYGGFMVFWTLGLAAVFYAYRSVRAAAIGQKFLSGHLFHFLLYLCTVEIAPVVILVKLAMLASK